MNPFKTRFFKHYKNKPYRYLGIVRHSETLEEMALYETLYENKLGKMWVRPKEMFFEDVVVDGIKQPRFRPIEFKIESFEKNIPMDMIADLYLKIFNTKFNTDKLNHKLKSPFLLLLAFDDQKPIGFKLGFETDNKNFYSWLGGILPEYQGLGVGALLITQQHEWCLSNKFKTISTKTRNQFSKMISLNLAHGFKIINTELKENETLILMKKEIL